MDVIEVPLRPSTLRMDRDRNTKRLTFDMVIDLAAHPMFQRLCEANRLYDSWIIEADLVVVIHDADRAKIIYGPRIKGVDYRGANVFRITGTCDSTSIVPVSAVTEQNERNTRECESTDSVTKEKIFDTFEYPVRCGGLTHQSSDGWSGHQHKFSIRFMSNDAPKFYDFLRTHKPATYVLKEVDLELKHSAIHCVHLGDVVITGFAASLLSGERYDVTVDGYAQKKWIGDPLATTKQTGTEPKSYPAPTAKITEWGRRKREIHERIAKQWAEPMPKIMGVDSSIVDLRNEPDPFDTDAPEVARPVPDDTRWPWIAPGSRGPSVPEKQEPFDRPFALMVNKIVTTGSNQYGINGAATDVKTVNVRSFEELEAITQYAAMQQPAVIGMIVGFPTDPMWQFIRYIYRRMLAMRTDRRYQQT